jgi:hypothetical protein
MVSPFNTPVLEILDNVLVRRSGLFYKKQFPLNEINRVLAVSRDAITHEETMVGLFDSSGNEFWMSEFDKNFLGVMESLEIALPGFSGLQGFAAKKPFEPIRKVLWDRPNQQLSA